MDRLERYLDWVCGRIAGPRELRAHIRRELSDHLLDAAHQHQSAGMSREDAVKKALDDFGAPDDVRADLEQTHGARLSAIVLEKALQWKEKAVKAKWFWKTWAHLALVAVLLMELAFICGATIFILPKFHQFANDVWSPLGAFDAWAIHFLLTVAWFVSNRILVLIVVAAAWTLFEWRVRSENKPFMRFAAIGTAATGLMIVIFLMGMALAITPLIHAPAPAARPQKTATALPTPANPSSPA